MTTNIYAFAAIFDIKYCVLDESCPSPTTCGRYSNGLAFRGEENLPSLKHIAAIHFLTLDEKMEP